MKEAAIQAEAKSFITSAKPALTSWDQQDHIVFLALILKKHCSLSQEQFAQIIQLGQEKPSLLTNASAFKQWLQSDKVALLPKAPAETGDKAAALLAKYGIKA